MINRKRRAEIRQEIGDWPHDYEVDLDELHTLLDYANERDEAVALLRGIRPFVVSHNTEDVTGPDFVGDRAGAARRIDALLRRVGGSDE